MPDMVGSHKNDGDPRVSLGTRTPSRASAIAWHMRRIFGVDEARNFKFGTRIEAGKSHLMNDKIHRRKHVQGIGANFYKF